MQMFLNRQWQDRSETIDVINPFDASVIDTIPKGTEDDVHQAITGLESGAKEVRALSGFERGQILDRAAQIMLDRSEDLARTISSEEGKILAESRVEAVRAAEVIRLSAEEARRHCGRMVPLDGSQNGQGKIGFTIRVPCGVVAAITPFNFPLNLVTHKLGPAIAGGNAILIKPASDTPLSALKLVEIMLEAGLPESAIACVTGSGSELGAAICEDERIRKITFTGSYEVGDAICKMAGMKRITMELGSNSPVIIMDDADLELAAKAVCSAGFANAGQVCISAQRVLTNKQVAGDFLDALKGEVAALTIGNQLEEGTRVGPMVRQADAERVESWVNEAVSEGAQMLIGGKREGALYQPTILDEVSPNSKVSRDELFGPAVAVTRFDDIHEAIKTANDTTFGLAAGIFTQDIDRAMAFAQQVDAGNININWSSQWRADAMPYGGLKHSGMGKEGPENAILSMTEEKMVILHLNQPS